MKKIEEVKQTYEFRIEEVLKILIPDQTAAVDYDSSVMRLKDGSTVLVLEVQSVKTK